MKVTAEPFRIVLILLFAGNMSSMAQESELLSADRPDQTEASSLVPPDYVQAEIGLMRVQSRPAASTISLPGVLIRYGLSEQVEVRLNAEYLVQSIGPARTTGLTPASAGLKLLLTRKQASVPSSALIWHVSIPKVSSFAFTTPNPATSFRIAAEHTISESISIGYNIGISWDGMSAAPGYLYTLVTGTSVNASLGAFAEVYGFASQQASAEHLVDAGLTYHITHDLMIDVSAGAGLTENAPDSFISAGCSYRFGLK